VAVREALSGRTRPLGCEEFARQAPLGAQALPLQADDLPALLLEPAEARDLPQFRRVALARETPLLAPLARETLPFGRQPLPLEARLLFEALPFEALRLFEALPLQTFGFEALFFEALGLETFLFEPGFFFEAFSFEALGFEALPFEAFGLEALPFEAGFFFEAFSFETLGFEAFPLNSLGLEALPF
jgi:hypothetical protein